MFKKVAKKDIVSEVNDQHLVDLLPYLGYDEDKRVLVGKNGDITKLFQLSLPEIFRRDNEYYNSLVQKLHGYISQMPEGYIIQRMDFVAPRPVNIDSNKLPGADDFTHLLIRHFNLQVPLESESYLFVTKKAQSATPVFFNTSFKKKKSDFNLLNSNQFEEKSLDNIYSEINGLIQELIGAGIGVRELESDDLNELILNKYLSLSFIDQEQRITIKDIVESAGLLHIGESICKVLSIYKDGFPDYIGPYVENSNYNNLPSNFLSSIYYGGYIPKIVNTLIYTHKKGYIKEFLKDNKRGVEFFGSEYWNKQAVEAMTPLIEDVEGLGLVSIHYSLTLIGNIFKYSQFKEEMDNIIFSMRSLGMDICENTNYNLTHFLSYLPGNGNTIPMIDRGIMPASMASCFPLQESIERNISYRGVPFFQRVSNNLIYIDIVKAKTTNKTILVFGKPGTGKSFTVNYLIDYFIREGHYLIISDLGMSYKKAAEFHGGVNMEATVKNPVKLNPFAVVQNKNGRWEYEDGADDETFLINLFFILWSGGDKDKVLSNNINSLFSKLIRNYLGTCSRNKQSPNYDDFYYHSIRDLESQNDLKDIDEAFTLAGYKLVMSQFLKKNEQGESNRYGFVFDEDVSDMDSMLNNRFVIFEMEHIKNDKVLFSITYYILSALVIRRLIRDKQKRGDKSLIFVMDECWMLLNGDYGNNSAFIAYCVRTFRKHGGVLIIITQAVADIANHEEIGDFVIKSSSIYLLKKQDANTEKDIQRMLNLSDFNTQLLYSIPDSGIHTDLFMQFDGVASTVSLQTCDYQYWLYTSNADDNRKLNEYRAKAPNIRVAIKNLLEDDSLNEANSSNN